MWYQLLWQVNTQIFMSSLFLNCNIKFNSRLMVKNDYKITG